MSSVCVQILFLYLIYSSQCSAAIQSAEHGEYKK